METEKRLDLISRNDLIKAVEAKSFAISDNTHPYEAIRIQGKYFREVVDNAPKVDAVEVVRCKNCINGIYDEVNDRYKCVKSAEYDSEFGDWLGFVSYCNADYYCADGERKDND